MDLRVSPMDGKRSAKGLRAYALPTDRQPSHAIKTQTMTKHPPPKVVRQPGKRARLAQILDRDGSTCVWCGEPFDGRFRVATTEHLVPRIKGGPSWLENEMAACRQCNKARGHKTIGQWASECIEAGWAPNLDAVTERLQDLLVTINERGGQRRARAYIESQLRRL